jgi:hypothetical protein
LSFRLKNSGSQLTKNVRWSGKTFGEFFQSENQKIMEGTDLGSSEEEDISLPELKTYSVQKETKATEKYQILTRSKALIDAEDEDSSDEEGSERIMMVEGALMGNPTSFFEAYNHEDSEKRKGWREAIKREIRNMENYNVWSLIEKDEVREGRKPIGNRWVFFEKRYGTLSARLVALGYSQVAGIDFSNHYSPVLCFTSFRIILTIIQKLKLKAWSIDIETAFLNGELTEEMYMKIPDGFTHVHEEEKAQNKVLRLNKSIYGLVQAARQWHAKFSEEIIKLGFKGNNVDPCVFTKFENEEFGILCINVDDGIITGSEKMMHKTVNDLNKVFK